MSHGSGAIGAGPQLSTFWADLTQHLTDLKLGIYCTLDGAHDLGTLSTLTALRELSIAADAPLSMRADMSDDDDNSELRPYIEVALKLPHLAVLGIFGLQKGKVVLSCPKLADISLLSTNSLCIAVKDAALESLEFMQCERAQFAFELPGSQLQNLKDLTALGCSELHRHLIQDVSQMRSLQKLEYVNFPAACMPSSFPQSLREIDLYVQNWSLDLPKGLKDLHALRFFSFQSSCRPWRFTKPLAELLPMNSLETVQVGEKWFDLKGQELNEDMYTLPVMTDSESDSESD